MISSRVGIGRLRCVSRVYKIFLKPNSPFLPTDLASCSGLGTNEATERVYFIDDEPLHALDCVLLFETEVEGFFTNWLV